MKDCQIIRNTNKRKIPNQIKDATLIPHQPHMECGKTTSIHFKITKKPHVNYIQNKNQNAKNQTQL